MSEFIRRDTYTYGYIDLYDNKIVICPASYATQEQIDSLWQDARTYVALASKPADIHISQKARE